MFIKQVEEHIFIFLLTDVKRNKYEGRYKKFYSSVKRSRGANIIQINEALRGKE